MSVSVIRFIARIIICGIISYTSVAADSGELVKGKENSLINLNLPKIIYAVPGIEMNVYFDNVTLTPNTSNFIFDVSCEKGLQQNERWTYIPSDTDAGDYPFSITVLDANNKIIDKAQSVVRVVPKDSGKGQNLTLLCIGDSLTHASVYTGHLLELTKSGDEPSITLVGSHFPNNNEYRKNRHEGYGGWTAQRFVTHYSDFARQGDYKERGSPFLYKSTESEPKLDFQRYCREINNSKNPDFVTIFLGCNDVFSSTDNNIDENINVMLKYYDELIKMISDSNSNTKIGLLLPVPPADTQDAFEANYQSGQTRWQYKRNQHRLVKQMLAKYENLENRNIYIVPTNINIDCHNNYPGQNVKVNSRSQKDIFRQNNGCHPAESGYMQIGDSVYCWIKSRLL